MCLNAIHTFGSNIFGKEDSAFRIIDVITLSHSSIHKLLYGPTQCRAKIDDANGIWKRNFDDKYERQFYAFMRKYVPDEISASDEMDLPEKDESIVK